MKKKILLTGGSGFIGQHLARALHDLNEFELHFLVRNKSDEAPNTWAANWENECALKNTLEKISPHYLFHLAAYAEPGRNLDHFTAQISNTILPTVQLARLIPQHPLEFAFFFGSCEEYGEVEPPFVESGPTRIVSPYGWGKTCSHSAASWICQARKIPYCWLRPFLTFGSSQLGTQLIPSLIRACTKDQELSLTEGQQTRDFIYVKDLVGMILRILRDPIPANGLAINLCSGSPQTIRGVAEKIRGLTGKGKLLFGELPYRENEVMNFYGDSSLFNNLYGKYDYTPFEVALTETLQSME